ncbi:hypothetical protein ACQ4PT_023498 [Festuca glaucescens]
MVKIIAAAPSLAGPLLRLHFHDCFVNGCDASVLLESTEGNVAEKDAKPNKSLRGFGSVERVKAKLEAACPGVVSCADVLTLMSRDAVVLAKGPNWPVALGRRDGRASSATEASNELPPARPTATSLCLSRYSPPRGSTSRTSSSSPAHTPSSMLSEMDPGSYKTFDTSYYGHVAKRRGFFRSDAALLTDDTTRDYVQRVATGKFDAEFFNDFSESMIKMGNVGVLTGAEREIRKKCHVLN